MHRTVAKEFDAFVWLVGLRRFGFVQFVCIDEACHTMFMLKRREPYSLASVQHRQAPSLPDEVPQLN